MKVGFIGLGNMGSGMAANLVKARHQVTVFNRTRSKAEPLVRAGAERAATAAEVAQGEVIITMLANDHAVEQIVFGKDGVLASLPAGAIHVSMSTISLGLAERLAAAHREAGQVFVSAPVFGLPEAASAAKLFIVAAGEPEALKTCQPLFDAMGQQTFVVGEEAPLANLVKLSGNFLIASVIEALSEAFALVGKGGIDPRQYLEILTGTLFGAPVYKTYGGLIAEERHHPAGFTALLGLKDVQLALEAARSLRVPMPMASLISDRLVTLLASGGQDLDWSALAKLAKRDAGAGASLGKAN